MQLLCNRKRKSLFHHFILFRSKHSQEKPFRCEVCSKSFARKDKLNDHMWSHTEEKVKYLVSRADRTQTSTDKLL